MSSRKSSSSREDLSSSRYGERTPLRNLNNEIQHLSTPSQRLKSKSQLGGDAVKMALGDNPLCSSDPLLETCSSPADKTQAGSGLGDVTFKSFICAGGEVEIAVSSVCTEGELALSEDAAEGTIEAEDSAVSQSLMEPSCCDHVEHPYFNINVKQPSSAGIGAVDVREISFSFCDVENEEETQDLQACHADCGEEEQVFLKSFICYGGEVELSDTSKIQEETIPLPVTDYSSQHITYSVNCSDCTQLCQGEHVDHPYCNSENDKADFTTFSEATTKSETQANRLSELTLKSFNCTGAEIEMSVGAEHIEEAVPLPITPTVSSCETYSYSVDPSALAGDDGLQNNSDRLDNGTIKPNSINIPTNQEVFLCSSKAVEVERMMESEGQDVAHEHSIVLLTAEDEKSDDNKVLEKLPPPFQTQCGNSQLSDDSVSTSLTQDFIEPANSHLENNEVVVDPDLPVDTGCLQTDTSLKEVNNDKVKHEVHEMAEPSESSDSSCLTASAEIPAHQAVLECLHYLVQECSANKPPESSEGEDSALGSSNGPAICTSTEKPTEDLPDFFKALSECPSVSSALQLGMLSPAIKRASLSVQKAPGNLPQNRLLADKFALEGDKSSVSPVIPELSKLWTEQMESPMPRPLFNSTAVGCTSQPGSAVKQKVDPGKRSRDLPQSDGVPLMPEAQLQQQLRQMAEFLILASGQMGAAGCSAAPPAAFTALSHKAPPAESHSVCVGTSPAKLVDHSLNTSGTFVRRKDLSVVDSCTETDPLVWNLSLGSLESLPKKELEQRLMSSLIMVEALVQQLTAARAHQVSAAPAPSDLREKLVQTDHTELSRTTMYRDLYVEALSRISDLELDGGSLQNLIQSMQDTKTSMAALSSDTDAALSNMKEWRDVVREDHQNLASHYEHMKSLFEKWKEMQMRMMQKVKEVLHEREDMRTRMEEAFTTKDAAFCAMEQLRTHCAAEISALEQSVGSQKELLAALNQTYPEQVALSKTSSETLNSASDILSQTMEEHSSLMNELHSVRILLQKTGPILLLLNEKTAAALRERDEHCSARHQAVEDREQIEEELKETNLNLQSARQQIGDLTRQVTIRTSEIGVLRQKLTEKEDETSQLERKVTELSATTSSTMASYAFLEQALIAETTKSQQSWKDVEQANERVNQLEASLQESKQRVCELTRALTQSEDHVAQLQTLSHSQSLQIQQLQDACAQLGGVQEMNEFLQMENELAQEQVAESERMLRTNLQALRERNIDCEDLKEDFSKLQDENKNLCEELKTTRSAANAAQAELKEKMAEAVTEITLLHHTLRGVTNELHAALSDQKQDQKESEVLCGVERYHSSSSFVDSIMVALTAEDVRTETSAASDPPEPQSESLFSGTSAFTLITAQASKKSLGAEEEQPCDVADLLSGLGGTVSELVCALKSLQQRKDSQLQELRNNIRSLQVEQQTASSHHQAEVMELKHELKRLQNLAERGNQALQQKTLDEKTLTKLMADVQEAQEILNKQKTDNQELRKEVVELRRTLQQSRVESQVLRDELRKSGGQSADAARYMEEKIQLVKEMERQKLKLQEAEQARVKLLERAKRHQIIHQTNIQKSETELQILNNMINKVRETLLSLPEVVKRCEQLQQLLEFIG